MKKGEHQSLKARDRSLVLRLLVAGVIVGAGLWMAYSIPQRSAAQVSPAQELAEKFAPVVMLREQESDCDREGEGYFPVQVDFLFNNPDIKLMSNTGGKQKNDPVLQEGITPQDLVTAGPDTYLDFPGNPRKPGCTYETYFKTKVEELGLEPATYANIVIDPVARRLYLQYWFYYYFNDWNNTHESDWEMMQLVFEGTVTPEDALQFGPSTTAFAQHAGGEVSSWIDSKVQKQGDRPIVFPSAGSHATYYDQHTFIGWGENGSAFGCDDTAAPSFESPVNVVLVPEVIDPDGEFAFFLYEGRWGERDLAMFSGPKGPNLGGKWNDPTEAIEHWRTSTLKVPDSSFGTVSSTDFFCGISKAGSTLFITMQSHLALSLIAVFGMLVVLGILLRRAWFYFMEALDIYGNELTTFLGIGSLVLPIGLISTLGVHYLIHTPPLSWIHVTFNASTSGELATSLVVGSLQQFAMILIVSPAVVYAMKDIRRGIKPGTWRSYKVAIRWLPVTLPAFLVIVAVVVAGTLSLILVPVMLYILVRFQFVAQTAIFENQKPFSTSLRASWEITRGHWIWAFLGSVMFQFLAVVPGPLIGVLVLIAGGTRVAFANFLSAFIYALTIPIATVAITMLYHRLADHEIIETRIVTRELPDIEQRASSTEGTSERR